MKNQTQLLASIALSLLIGTAHAQSCALIGAAKNQKRNHQIIERAEFHIQSQRTEAAEAQYADSQKPVESLDDLFPQSDFIRLVSSSGNLVYLDRDIDQLNHLTDQLGLLDLILDYADNGKKVSYNQLPENEKKKLQNLVAKFLVAGSKADLAGSSFGVQTTGVLTMKDQDGKSFTMYIPPSVEKSTDFIESLGANPVKFTPTESQQNSKAEQSSNRHTDIFLAGGDKLNLWGEATNLYLDYCRDLANDILTKQGSVFQKFQQQDADIFADRMGEEGVSFQNLSKDAQERILSRAGSNFKELGFETKEDAQNYYKNLTFDVSGIFSFGFVMEGAGGEKQGVFMGLTPFPKAKSP